MLFGGVIVKIRVKSQFTVQGADNMDAETDELMAALLSGERADDRISEADLTVSLAKRLVVISLVVESDSWAEAESTASQFVLAAIRSVGGVVRGQLSARSPEQASLVARVQSTELVPA